MDFSLLYFGYFVAVYPWCICTSIYHTFIYAHFSSNMRASMSCFPGTTLYRLIDTSCRSIDICYNILLISTKSLHTLCILIGMQHPHKLFLPIHIPKQLLKNSSCGTEASISSPGPSRKYFGWKKIVQAIDIINLYKMAPL